MYSILYHRFFSAASFKTFFFSCLEEAGLKSGNLVQFPQQLQVFFFFFNQLLCFCSKSLTLHNSSVPAGNL